MYRTKKDVDKHVENLISKLSVKEFKTRAYSVARLYYEVGDYALCQRYVEQYLSQKENNAAAHKLLGQALQKLGQKEKALEQYKISLDIDPTQTSTILDICELLADDELVIDPGRAKYWYEKAEDIFPRHPVTFRLRERLVTISNPDPEALVKLLTAELEIRPKDAVLHCRLLKHYMNTNQIKEAFEHGSKTEFGNQNFANNFLWYETLAEIVNNNDLNVSDWLYQLLLLTVRERLCALSITETPSGTVRSLVESNDLLHAYDQAIEKVAKTGAPSGFGEFHSALLQHHRGQFVFHAATLFLKKAKKDQISWRDAINYAAPLMLLAWQTVPLDSKVNWLSHAPEKQQIAVRRWYTEGAYRCSQSGHYLITNVQDKCQSFLDKVSQTCSGIHWRDKLYEKMFTSRDHLSKIKSSHFVSSAFNTPVLRMPRRIEVEAYDADAQREYPNSLHHFVWMIQNYKNYANFTCTLFDMLAPSSSNCGPETLSKLDIYAFLYFAAYSSHQQKSSDFSYISPEKPNVLPANITNILCSLPQMKWWDCAYKFSHNELGSELTDIRATLSRGIEVVRCVDNHGLDPEILCIVAKIFSEKAKTTTSVDEKNKLEIRAGLYYSVALPQLEKLKSNIMIKMPEKRLFDYTHKELSSRELNGLIEESKLYIASNHLKESEYDKAIELLSTLKSADAYYQLSQAYRKLALEEINMSGDNLVDLRSKFATLVSKAKQFAYKALDKIKDTESNKSHPLYADIQQSIEDIETLIHRIDPDLSGNNHDVDGKYSSDENISSTGSEHTHAGQPTLRNNNHMLRNLSSTPKQVSNSVLTQYRTAVDSQILDNTRVDPQFLDKIENQIKSFQKKLADDFIQQTKNWYEENKRLGNQIMSTIQSDIQNTTDQFKLLKISVDQVKDQIDECRNECKDVGELKKQVAELKKEVIKLKKASSEQNIDESDLYNIDDDYRTNESTSSYTAQLPFQHSQVMPPFNQRLVPPFPLPPNPYLYNQSLYNLYTQYSQLAQNATMPGAPPLFDPTKLSYPGVYPTPDQMYVDMAHLVPPSVGAMPPNPGAPPISVAMPSHSTVPSKTVSLTTTSVAPSKLSSTSDAKDASRALPVNVVITSSDPLPSSTTVPAPLLSVTIPPKHIKGTPHNYQIPMPPSNDVNTSSPPMFGFSTSGNKEVPQTASSVVHWNQTTTFKPSQSIFTTTSSSTSLFNTSAISGTDGNQVSVSPNTSVNKSRTLSERSNTSIENYDPCPDFKPIIPLPDEVKVTTGEEDETVIFSARAKLFRFVEKEWKERGIGEMKLLKHKLTGKVRVLMRREQIHKICANHNVTSEMEIKPMKNETKAYFWVANDFADETFVLETFCIRFKTADIAQKFYETFEKARKDARSSTTSLNITNSMETSTPRENIVNATQTEKASALTASPLSSNSVSNSQNKTQFGGFTFTSTPTLKPIKNENPAEVKCEEPVTTKLNVFSNLNFKTTTTSSFTNLFGVTVGPTNTTSPAHKEEKSNEQEKSNKLNTSDVVEEFEPNVEFKPVVPLPALVDLKTGEEDENVLFEHRAKLLRFDASVKEWKERGLGNIKLLVHKDNAQKVRLLMRREQIMKICCNHAVTKDMTFQKMPSTDKALTWCAKDYSEGELVAETFCLRFKTIQTCDAFLEAIKSAQSRMKDDSKAAKEEQNAAKQSNQVGFGDMFKPKAGSWSCDSCYTNNLESFSKCACCEQPKPGFVEDVKSITPAAGTIGFGDKFKPKAGSWECSACLIRNDASKDYCSACNNSKDPSMPKKDASLLPNNAPKFKFGIPAPNTNNSETPVVAISSNTTAHTWGDKFKPKEGTWECNSCFVRNGSGCVSCTACNSPREPHTTSADSGFVNISMTQSGPKFTFGIPTGNIEKPKSESQQTTSIFDGTGAHKFSFGIPANIQEKSSVVSFGEQKPSIFGASKPTTGTESPLNLTASKAESKPSTPVKPGLLPTPQTVTTPFGDSQTHATFEFVFKPKTPPKGKSPAKSPKADGDDSDGDGYASEDEGHHIHFNPIIPLPDKVEVVTGEENESELYSQRAKLFRFIGGEWKERGIGVVKILKHKETGKLRVVMRREQVLKICLNHALTPEITYTPKDEKTWLFAANDFSEGELSLQQFCLRFKTKDIASEFKEAVENTRAGKLIVKRETEPDKKDNDIEEVVFVSEMQASAEDKKKAKELLLPENFFNYKSKEPCKGCRGCEVEDDNNSIHASVSLSAPTSVLPVSTSEISTPVRTVASVFQSPANSFYGTPANFDKTGDASIFRTPLGSLASNTNSASLSTPTNANLAKDCTNKENMFTQKNIFGGTFQTNIFGTPKSSPASIFAAAESACSKSSILAPPKLGTLNTSGGENQNTDPKSLFAAAQSKALFNDDKPVSLLKPDENSDREVPDAKSISTGSGVKTDNNSIFSYSSKSETKPVFGVDDDKAHDSGVSTPANIFQAAIAQQKPTFGSSAATFGNTVQPHKQFDIGKQLFGSASQQDARVIGPATETKPDLTKETPTEVKKENEPVLKETPFKVDNSLSFAALSSTSGAASFSAQKKSDFQWEGAGQQLFTSAQKAAAKDADKSKNDSGADESTAGAEEEYDPHYEPIVPLPDKIVVTTGEEDEEKMFGERAKLYRYDEKTREWKERGVGELKILHHPERKTYRLLLRREQVHKAVLNMLIFMDLELLPMKNSDRAWTWAGRNFAETAQGEQETLAVRFKSVDLAATFRDKVVECTRKLQAAAAQAIKEVKDMPIVTPLRLPKHLESSARADLDVSSKLHEHTLQPQAAPTSQTFPKLTTSAEVFKQVHFEEAADNADEEDDGDYDYDHNEDYDAYYNEEEEESASYYECIGDVAISTGDSRSQCESAHIQVLFDQDCCSPKILITDSDTGEILADMLIHTDTEFQMDGESCSWAGRDYTSNEPVDKAVTVNFPDTESAMQFYDSCETSKGATYSSTDPES